MSEGFRVPFPYVIDKLVMEPIDLDPDIVGECGLAWKCFEPTPKLAHLVQWVVEAPWAHPFWHSYSICLIHLRTMPGMPPPILYGPWPDEGCMYEMWVHALDPTEPRVNLVRGGKTQGWLDPANFAAQFIDLGDDVAMQRIEQTVRMICNGHVSPDTDYRDRWIRLFGDSMIAK